MNDLFHAALVMIDGARPAHGVFGRVVFAESWCEAKARPAFLAHGAIERVMQALLAGRARRLEQC